MALSECKRSFSTYLLYSEEQSGPNGPLSQLLLPNSNAYVDMNGDCVSDLIVTSMGSSGPQLEIWLNEKASFRQDKVLPLLEGASGVIFSDFDRDGTMDILYSVCHPSPNCSDENSIHIIYNVQKPICGDIFSSRSNCRPSSELCTADDYQLGVASNVSSNHNSVLVPTAHFQNRHFQWTTTSAVMIRSGDFNLDGFPDLLIPMVGADGSTIIELWENVPCTESLCGPEATSSNRRTFQQMTNGVNALSDVKGSYVAAFFDFDEDGVLDILTLSEKVSEKDSSVTPTINAVFNNFFNDAFFLKTMGLNGVWGTLSKPKPFGVNFPGTVWKYTVTDLGGGKSVAQGVQLRQSGGYSLQTPYILFGLGRTSNYIEEIFMGDAVNEPVQYALWTTIIPNSQVVGIPYPKDTPENWILELYIKSSGLALWAAVAVLSWLIVTGVLICFFSWREKRQDELLKQEMAHLFSFDAM